MINATVELQIENAVATLTLNRPEALNALDDVMIEGLQGALAELQAVEGLRAVILKGAGDHFMAGGDIGYFYRCLQLPPEQRRPAVAEVIDKVHQVTLGLRELPAPVIAVIRGSVAGFGVSLVAAADLAIASEEAQFCQAYLQIGTTPDGGNTFFMPRALGWKKAMELTLLNDRFDASQARQIGLVNQVVPAAELEQTVAGLLKRLCHGPAEAIARAKALFNASLSNTLEQQLEAERDSFADSTLTPDFAEGIQAFIEKRLPNFGQ